MNFKKQNDDGTGIWVQDPVWRKGDILYGTYVRYVLCKATGFSVVNVDSVRVRSACRIVLLVGHSGIWSIA